MKIYSNSRMDGASIPLLGTNHKPQGSEGAKLALLALLGSKVQEVAGKSVTYDSGDEGKAALLQSQLTRCESEYSELLTKRQAIDEKLNATERYPAKTAQEKAGISLSFLGSLLMSGFSWGTAAQYLEMNFTDTFLQGLVFSSVVPFVPFGIKYFILTLGGKRRLHLELGLLILLLLAIGIFSSEFARLFAKKPTLDLSSLLNLETFDHPASATVSLRWFFFGQSIVEFIISYAFFSWLLFLLSRRPNPDWIETDYARMQICEQMLAITPVLDQLRGQLTELQQRKNSHEALVAKLSGLLQ